MWGGEVMIGGRWQRWRSGSATGSVERLQIKDPTDASERGSLWLFVAFCCARRRAKERKNAASEVDDASVAEMPSEGELGGRG